MNRRPVHPAHRPFLVAVFVVSTLVLTGCGGGVSGKYSNEMMEVDFKGGGKAYISSAMGGSSEVKYKVDGDKIILENQAGNMVLTREKDGSLSGGPLGMPLKKAK